MNTLRQLPAALGAGFYRYWHVPAPDAVLDIRATRRADLSVIGPGALALVALGSCAVGQVGASMVLNERLATPLSALPTTAQIMVLVGTVGLLLAVTWWLGTARVRARVAAGVAGGTVARIPDDPADDSQQLHAAVTQLGRTLRNLPEPEARPLADPAFEVLRTAASALSVERDEPDEEQRRLRRRCLTMAQRLEGRFGPGMNRPVRDHMAA